MMDDIDISVKSATKVPLSAELDLKQLESSGGVKLLPGETFDTRVIDMTQIDLAENRTLVRKKRKSSKKSSNLPIMLAAGALGVLALRNR